MRIAGRVSRSAILMNLLAAIAALVFVLDQVTKWLVITHLPFETSSVTVISGFFTITHVTNRGAAWGLFSKFAHSNAVLTAFSIITVAALFALRRSLAASRLSQKISLGLIVGGIFGNLADRIFRGSVVDFLDFYLGPTLGHWPSFNIADSAICIGVFLYLVQILRGHHFGAHHLSDQPPSEPAAPEKS